MSGGMTGTNGPRPRKRRRSAQVRFPRAIRCCFTRQREEPTARARYLKARLHSSQSVREGSPIVFYKLRHFFDYDLFFYVHLFYLYIVNVQFDLLYFFYIFWFIFSLADIGNLGVARCKLLLMHSQQ